MDPAELAQVLEEQRNVPWNEAEDGMRRESNCQERVFGDIELGPELVKFVHAYGIIASIGWRMGQALKRWVWLGFMTPVIRCWPRFQGLPSFDPLPILGSIEKMTCFRLFWKPHESECHGILGCLVVLGCAW